VAALLQVLGPAYLVIKLVGGAYLVFLGARSLISALRRGNSEGAATPPSAPQSRASTSFLQGLVSNLANPKMAVFFVSLLPQFAGAVRRMLDAVTGVALAALGLRVAVDGVR